MSSSSLYVRMTDGRDRGRKLDVVRETALEMIHDGRAILVDPRDPDFIPDFTHSSAAELQPQRQHAELERLQMQAPENPPVLAGGGGSIEDVGSRRGGVLRSRRGSR